MARILLGVTGGIAAYKALELARLATRAGHSVRVLMTPSATRFVGVASFEGIVGAPVLMDEFELALGDVWVESARFSLEPAFDLEALAQREDAVGSLLRSLAHVGSDAAEQRELAKVVADSESALPPELRGLDLEDPELLKELCAGARRILLPRIVEEL